MADQPRIVPTELAPVDFNATDENWEGLEWLRGHMRPIRKVIGQAYDELIKPAPSIKIVGWEKFSEITGGLRTKEFTILCGSTGSGKTTFLANLSAQLLSQKVKHFVASVETGDTDFVKRVISVLVQEDLNSGEEVPFERVLEIKKAWDQVLFGEDLWLSTFDNRINVNLLLKELEIAYHTHGCKVAMLDNLNFFLEVTTSQNAIIEMDRVVHEIIMFCKRIDMHVIMVMHPKKTDLGRVESEFDVKGSSTAVQEAHNVLLFNRPSAEDQRMGWVSDSFRELKIAKLRRRGKYVGKRLMFRNVNSCYLEQGIM